MATKNDSQYQENLIFLVNPNVAKVEDAADGRRQGFGCSRLRRILDNGSSLDPALAGRCGVIGFPKG